MPFQIKFFDRQQLLVCLFAVLVSAIANCPAKGQDRPLQLYGDQYGGLRAVRKQADRFPRLSAEFEVQRFLLMSASDWQPHHRHILAEIATKTARHVNLLILVDDFAQMRTTTKWLMETKQPLHHVYFSVIDVDTVWVRDFGPLFMQQPKGALALDFFYEGSRPKDDSLPQKWTIDSNTKHRKINWTLQGGNLLCNGAGLALTTTRIFKDNFITFPGAPAGQNSEIERRKIVIKNLMEACNLAELCVLEPLQNEATRHCDMFTSFLSPQDLLVARLDRNRDPVNAQILERNVARLKNIVIDRKPLRIHRIDLPPRQGESWSAYTNAIVANNLVLIPTFDRDPPQTLAAAKAVYRRLLPRHTVETINMTTMRNLQGELHCLSLHVPEFAPYLKTVYAFSGAKQTYFPSKRLTKTQSQ